MQGEVADPGATWPLPQQWTSSDQQMTIDPTSGFIFTSNLINCDVIDEAFVRYRHWIQLDKNGIPNPDLSPLQQLSVSVVDLNCSSYPALGDDESCKYLIQSTTLTIQYFTLLDHVLPMLLLRYSYCVLIHTQYIQCHTCLGTCFTLHCLCFILLCLTLLCFAFQPISHMLFLSPSDLFCFYSCGFSFEKAAL